MTIEELKTKKKILIIGYGVEGQAAEKFLQKHCPEMKVTIIDQKDGDDYLDHQTDYELAIKSPGVHPKAVKIPYTTVTNIFLANCKGNTIGVTGTKGKGTTSSLIYEMLKKSHFDVYLGGNIGEPPINFLDKLTDTSWTVLELSSFQLQDVTKSPHIAVMLMITEDHLNYHADISEYVDAKRNILRFQTPEDFAVINRDYIASNESDIYTEGKVFYVTRERTTTDQGAFIKENAIWLTLQGAEWKIIDTDKLALVGKHNWENAAAAAMAATLAGATKSDIVDVLKTFQGLEHRLEFVREVKGVKYYNDSFSAQPGATIAAIEAFTEPEILILGGSHKGSDFSDLGATISNAKNIKAIIGIGEEWPRIKEELGRNKQQSAAILIEGAKDMQTIVQAAAKVAQPGDVVLLSPGCASFDMFKNYKDRGEQYKEEVEKLKD